MEDWWLRIEDQKTKCSSLCAKSFTSWLTTIQPILPSAALTEVLMHPVAVAYWCGKGQWFLAEMPNGELLFLNILLNKKNYSTFFKLLYNLTLY